MQTVSLIGIAYLCTWMFNHTRSLFLLIFFHALSNTVPEMASRAILPDPLTPLLIALVPWVIVLVLKIGLWKERFPGPANAVAQ